VENIITTLFASSFLGILGCYIHAIRPSPVGIPMDPFLGLIKPKKSKGRKTLSEFMEIEPEASRYSMNGVEEDDDVKAEKMRVESSDMSDSREAIRMVKLSKTYGAKTAVDSISLSIYNGETFGLLGPNGAGKTTTLSMITGMLERTSGSVMIAGRSIDDAKSSKGRNAGLWKYVGVTPQFDTVWPEMTVEEHLYFYCRLRGVVRSSLANMVRRIAEDIELDGDAFRQKAGGLSGGMKRRLSIGISLTANPRILVLDEPTTGLDPETKRQVWRVIDRVKKTNPDRCVIITTHSMVKSFKFSHSVILRLKV
jgi:ABC-type multidrug transport system ATPase subunit